jgi:uncharacterized protein YbjT (DUF2867 family)
MNTALIAGSSGLVGSYLLQLLLDNENYSLVKALVREPMNVSHPRLEQIIYDFDHPDADQIRADHVYCCLGTTIKKAGSKDAFKKVDYDYPLRLAINAQKNGTTHFGIVTAMGANSKSLIFYNKVKGSIENDLMKIPFESLNIFRPSMLTGPRKENRLGEEIGKVVMKGIDFLLPQKVKAIHASKVAFAMVFHMQKGNPGLNIFDSGKMQDFPAKKTT